MHFGILGSEPFNQKSGYSSRLKQGKLLYLPLSRTISLIGKSGQWLVVGSIPGSVLPRGRDSVDRRRHLPPLLPHRLSRHRPGAECEYRHKVRASDPGQNGVNFQQFMSSKASDKLCQFSQCYGGCSWCHFITEVKPHWTRILLRWATAWKFLVLLTWAQISMLLMWVISVESEYPRVEVCHAGVISARGLPLGTTCNHCYKRFTRLYLQVCKSMPKFKINYSPTCCQIQYADACFHF